MKIDIKLVKEIQELAKLKFSPKEIKLFQKEFKAILNFVEKIKEVETEEKEVFHRKKFKNKLREDKAKEPDKELIKNLIKLAPLEEKKMFKVKRIFEEKR